MAGWRLQLLRIVCVLGILTTALINVGLSSWHARRHPPIAKPKWASYTTPSSFPEEEVKSKKTLEGPRRNATTAFILHTNASSAATKLILENGNKQQQPNAVNQLAVLEKMLQVDLQSPHRHFSACLLIKDDNTLLNEWIAYHYHTLKLRFLVIAVDPHSVMSPRTILERWQNLTGLQVVQWSDQDYMPQSFLDKGYVIPLEKIDGNASNSKWHLGFEDANQVKLDKQRISNHRFRQLTFLPACYRHLRNLKKTWVLHIDTDEYLSVNPILRARGKNGLVPVPKDLREPMVLFRFLLAIRYRPRLKTMSNFPCISLPRLLYGAHVTTVDDATAALGRRLVHDTYNASKFETLHWKYHTLLNDRERNAMPKVIVDVSAVNETDEMFKRKAFSIHRPSKKLCRFVDQMDFAKIQSFPLMVNHYLGSWERYNSRNDTRRSLHAYQAKAFVKDGRDDWISTWIDGFLDNMDAKVARQLLQDYV